MLSYIIFNNSKLKYKKEMEDKNMINTVVEIASIEEYKEELTKINMKRNILGLGQVSSLRRWILC